MGLFTVKRQRGTAGQLHSSRPFPSRREGRNLWRFWFLSIERKIAKFVVGPAARVLLARWAARSALKAASGAATGARAGRVWIAAYDVETGAVAVGHSGPVPSPRAFTRALSASWTKSAD